MSNSSLRYVGLLFALLPAVMVSAEDRAAQSLPAPWLALYDNATIKPIPQAIVSTVKHPAFSLDEVSQKFTSSSSTHPNPVGGSQILPNWNELKEQDSFDAWMQQGWVYQSEQRLSQKISSVAANVSYLSATSAQPAVKIVNKPNHTEVSQEPEAFQLSTPNPLVSLENIHSAGDIRNVDTAMQHPLQDKTVIEVVAQQTDRVLPLGEMRRQIAKDAADQDNPNDHPAIVAALPMQADEATAQNIGTKHEAFTENDHTQVGSANLKTEVQTIAQNKNDPAPSQLLDLAVGDVASEPMVNLSSYSTAPQLPNLLQDAAENTSVSSDPATTIIEAQPLLKHRADKLSNKPSAQKTIVERSAADIPPTVSLPKPELIQRKLDNQLAANTIVAKDADVVIDPITAVVPVSQPTVVVQKIEPVADKTIEKVSASEEQHTTKANTEVPSIAKSLVTQLQTKDLSQKHINEPNSVDIPAQVSLPKPELAQQVVEEQLASKIAPAVVERDIVKPITVAPLAAQPSVAAAVKQKAIALTKKPPQKVVVAEANIGKPEVAKSQLVTGKPVSKIVTYDAPAVTKATVPHTQLASENKNNNASVQIFNEQRARKDACYRQLWQGKSNKRTCQDNYLSSQLGPELAVLPLTNQAQAQAIAMTIKPIDERAYHIYCLLSGNCPNIDQASMPNEPQNLDDIVPIDLDLSDIERSVRDYNVYCAMSGKCPGVFNAQASKIMTNINYEQAKDYAAWLSQKTGHQYRLPTAKEWSMALRADASACDLVKEGLPMQGTLTTRWGMTFYPSLQYEWVASAKGGGLLGLQQLTQSDSCQLSVQLQSQAAAAQTGFRLVRVIPLG